MRKFLLISTLIFIFFSVGCSKDSLNIINNDEGTIIQKTDNRAFTDEELEEIYDNIDYENSAISVDGKVIYIYK
ncbi:hypothetical protein [Paraclostridium bifermentans]|uniref:hypothetical protein n=1 Tax=Paraclostridium bifermentans TaxID=1490 RepID=UPI00189F55C4|nr:hypothetical protein [Paraclostridium bifermentans]